MELWYTEKQTPSLGITCLIRETLCRKQTKYQDLAIIDTLQFGKMLVLDGMVQTTEKDEFVYHEMLAHIAMQAHPHPRHVLVVGGGDGGVIREVLKYDTVETATLVEIDGEVIAAAKEYLPQISVGLDDPRVTVLVADGVEHVKTSVGKYDIILIDSTEPVGPAVGLSARNFTQYLPCFKKGQLMVAQTESPFNQDLISGVYSRLNRVFPWLALSGQCSDLSQWSLEFTAASKCYDPLECRKKPVTTKYYNFDVHQGAFALPNFVRELLKEQTK